MSEIKKLKIRPYARLLTMLGEQLIKNERIALVELIKNAYDADANWIKVSFIDFGENYEVKPSSLIVIEDDGNGMNSETIEKHWLNPATPVKKIKKQEMGLTEKGRFIQGEKGIGRFAILKLGRRIQIISRAKGELVENIVDYNFERYDDDFLTDSGTATELFIDDLEVTLQERTPKVIVNMEVKMGPVRRIKREPKGTRIEISGIKGSWSAKKVEAIVHDLSKFETIFHIAPSENEDLEDRARFGEKDKSDFEVAIFKDDEKQNYEEKYLEKLNLLLINQSVIRIEDGVFDADKEVFSFKVNGIQRALSLQDPAITGINVFRRHFVVDKMNILEQRKTECGSFKFGFFIFDFSPQAPIKYLLDKEDKDIIRAHRIYLYRDGVRVYPYGEPDDDWLRVDTDRGTISAGAFLSNDQVVGYVSISQEENHNLQDKTNREGLIEKGNSTDDFLALLRILLAYVRQKPYAQYKNDNISKNAQDVFHTEQIKQNINELKEIVKTNKQAQEAVDKLEKDYTAERKYLVQRAETTEELAGVGLSVETASHDIMAIMGKTTGILDGLINDTLQDGSIDTVILQKELQSLRGMLAFIESQLKDIQLLFKSSKQRRRAIRVKEVIVKIERIYKRILTKKKISLVINEKGSPLVVKTTDAVLLQLFLNLFDNSIYWLEFIAKNNKKIEITLDGDKGVLIFSDNGPGINKEDKPYIFQPFYSGKGEEGRGLGLYIAKQLLERNDYAIELAELRSEKVLEGANFVINFISEEN